ncbi:MAG: thioesterase [Actinobacteria bacterium]|nr:MAG: thioesterase [Actinomycetota bacterium]
MDTAGPPDDQGEALLDALVGASGTVKEVVTDAMTARSVGSGDVDVLSTPSLLALIEQAAVASLAGKLPEGTTTVGASVKLAHLEPTPVGTTVKVTASIERVRSRRLHFIFSAFDGWGEVAGGHHVRALVDRARFEAGATARAAEPPEEL